MTTMLAVTPNDLDRVRSNFAEWPNAHVLKGVLPDALALLPNTRTAFLHIDLNCAAPEVAVLENF